jgi:hypothetical protein
VWPDYNEHPELKSKRGRNQLPQSTDSPPHPFFKITPWIWVLLILGWLPLAPVSLMAFDAGYNWHTHLFIGAFWSYPLSVILVFLMKRAFPAIVFLPILNILLATFAG